MWGWLKGKEDPVGRGQESSGRKGAHRDLGVCMILLNRHIHPEPFQEAELTNTFAPPLGWL